MGSGLRVCFYLKSKKTKHLALEKLSWLVFPLAPKSYNIVQILFQFTGYEKEGKKYVLMRSYKVSLKKSSSGRLPRIELEEIGPRVDMLVRRLHLASEDHFASACKQVNNNDQCSLENLAHGYGF